MARIFVYSDSLNVAVEIEANPLEGTFSAYCLGCVNNVDIVGGTSEARSMAETLATGGRHADVCDRCSKSACTTPHPHVAGERCRIAWRAK